MALTTLTNNKYCVSEATRRTVIEKYHQDPSKVTAVHNAVTPLAPEILAIPDKRGSRIR